MEVITSLEGRRSVRRRLKQFVGRHLRQVPCLDAVVRALPSSLRFWRRRKYQTLGQGDDDDEEGGEVEDLRQSVNDTLGTAMVRLALLSLIGLTVLNVTRGSKFDDENTDWSKVPLQEFEKLEFRRDAGLILYLGALELLVCGACAQTAAAMYTKRRHAMKHPQDGPESQRKRYIKVHLEKDPGRRDRQLYGIGFRASTDGLECLLVEEVRTGSLLDVWNARRLQPSPAQLLEAALGDSPSAAGRAQGAGAGATERVGLGAAIVAVNDVHADVGLMQAELTKAKVTLWVRTEVFHASQLESDMLAEHELPAGAASGRPVPATFGAADAEAELEAPPAGAAFGFSGRPGEEGADGALVCAEAVGGPRCAVLAFEDEEAQIVMRWLICGILFGWVTLLPVLLVQPNEERPRQHLFRQYLLKPCLLILPLWILFWVLDCIEVAIETQIMHPFFYFPVVHMLLPSVLVYYLMKLQAADEQIVLEQRKSRQAELKKDSAQFQPVAIEDAAPALLKELICVNPVAMIFLGAVASIPILVWNLLTPLSTERGRLAQGFINIMYAPLTFLQVAFCYSVYHFRFIDLPKLYMTTFGLMLSLPCFAVWCLCLMCASRYGRQDMLLVERQRVERAREAVGEAAPGTAALSATDLVDLTEAMQREFEFINSA